MSRVSMRVFSSSLLLIFLLSCTLFKKTQDTPSTDLMGKITIQSIQESIHKDWFNKESGTYLVDTETLADFNNNPERIEALSIKIFMGTWCEDSQREVPRFYNILNFLNVTKYEIIGLDEDKKSPQKFEKGMNIHHVPTFIIYQNGVEVNRIIESPIKSLEKDLIDIIQVKKYVPNYE